MLARSDPAETRAGLGSLGLARLLAFLIPAGLLAGAYAFEHIGKLPPCEMCWWQRYGHFAALLFAVPALFTRRISLVRPLVLLAASGIAVSGGIGAYHAGVEAGVLEGLTQCTAAIGGAGVDPLAQILAAPLVRCDQVPWSLFGISMAGWNAILSLGGALVVLWLSFRPSTRR